jgi:hypothetical protein
MKWRAVASHVRNYCNDVMSRNKFISASKKMVSKSNTQSLGDKISLVIEEIQSKNFCVNTFNYMSRYNY